MNEPDRLRRSVDRFTARVSEIPSTGWYGPTPCTEWNVRALVNHITYEASWLTPLLRGETMAEVGGRLDGDLLGAAPAKAWAEVAAEALAAAQDPENLARTIELSYGPTSGASYVGEVAFDVAIHTWDLARAIGDDEVLDGELVAYALDRDDPRRTEAARRYGLLGPAVEVGDSATPQDLLLARLGRWADPTFTALARFWQAVDSGDREAVAAAISDDFHFDSTPPPDGQEINGRDAASDFFAMLRDSAEHRLFSVEEAFTSGDRAVVRWRHEWTDHDGSRGHVRGVDLFRVRDGLMAEKLSYVKG